MARGQPEGEQVYTPQVPVEDLPRKIVPHATPEDFGAQVGAGLEQASEAEERKYAADSATYANDQLTQARASAIETLENAKNAAPAGDPGNFTERYLGQFDKTIGAPLTEKTQGNPYAARMVNSGLLQLRSTLAEHSLAWEATQRKASQIDSVQQNVDKSLPLVRSQPALADQVMGSTLATINTITGDPETKLKLGRLAESKITREAALGVTDQNPTSVYAQLRPGGEVTDPVLKRLVDPEARAQVLEQAAGGMVHSAADHVADAYRQGGPEAGQKAYGSIDQMRLDPDTARNDAILDKVREQVRARRGEIVAEAQQTHSKDVIALEESLKGAQPDPNRRSLIWGGYHNNWLTPEQTGAYLGEDDRIRHKATDDGAGLGLIQDAWNGKVFLDPKDPDQKKDANNWFIDATDRNKMAQGSDAWVNLGAEFAHRTGMIPEPVGAWARSVMVASKDPSQVVAAANAMDRMRQASPRGFEYLDDDHKLSGMADDVLRLTKAGMQPDQAVAQARSNFTAGEQDRKRMDELWKTAKPFGANDAALDQVLQSQINNDPHLTEQHWYGNKTPPRPVAMQQDYYNLVRSYFAHNGGNAASAEGSAARDIGTTWGVTAMNGHPEIVRYPPERMFRAPDGGPGLTANDIQTDLAQTVNKSPQAFQRWSETDRKLEPFKPDPSKVRIVPIDKTGLTNGRTWGLEYENEHGVQEMLYGTGGKPLEYNMPVTTQDYQALRSQALKDANAKAQAEYDRRTAAEAAARAKLDADLSARPGFGGPR